MSYEDGSSDPYSLLEYRTAKHASLATELHLGRKKITKLANFETFISLDTLWVNDNGLVSLMGLEQNIRLRHLYAHCNKITSVEDTLRHFKFLITLTLNENNLLDSHEVISELKHLRYLQVLNLYGNAVAQEDNYRLKIISEIPWIKVLDRIKVTPEEVHNAKEYKVKQSMMDNYTLQSKKPPKGESQLAFEERQQRLVGNALASMNERIKKRRIILEPFYVQYDKRKLGLVDEDIFLRVLRENALHELIGEEEEEALLKKYRKKVTVEAISATMTLPKRGICYKKFCSDMLPAELRVLEDEWKVPKPEELSKTGKDLQNFVRRVKKKRHKEEETLRRTALLSASKSEPVMATYQTVKRKSKLETHGLDPWTGSELLKIVKKLVPADGNFKKEDILAVFQAMINVGKVPVVGTSAACEVLLTSEVGNAMEALPDQQFRSCIGLDVPLGTDASKYSGPIINWRDLSKPEVRTLRDKTFRTANNEFQQLIRTSDVKKQKNLMTKTFDYSTTATKFAAKDTRESPKKGYIPPSEVMKSAPIRSDYFVLPRLNVVADKIDGINEWESKFSQLGLSGEALSIAIERKERSMILQKKLEDTMKGLKKQSVPAPNDKKKGAAGGEKKKKALSVLEIMANPPPPPKGWNKNTGTLFVESTDHPLVS